MRIISVRLDNETDAKLRSVCERTGMSQTEVVKKAIIDIADRPAVSAYELAKQMGLIGAFGSGVGDLGKNHSRYIKEKLARQHRDRR
jgi:hypothetical protein